MEGRAGVNGWRRLIGGQSQPSLRTEARWLEEGRTCAAALIAVERILLHPYDDAGLLKANYQAGRMLPMTASEAEVAGAIRSVLTYRPRVIDMRSLTQEVVSDEWDASRRYLMKVFGVQRQRDWLQDARSIGITGVQGLVVFRPSHNLRRATPTFDGLNADLSISASLGVDEELAAGLFEANARCS